MILQLLYASYIDLSTFLHKNILTDQQSPQTQDSNSHYLS